MKYLFLLTFSIVFMPKPTLALDLNTYEIIKQNLEIQDQNKILDRIELEVPSLGRGLTNEEEASILKGVSIAGLNSNNFLNNEKSALQAQYNFEKDTLEFEQWLRRMITQKPIYANELDDDGAVELIEDLNDLDEILFGEKHKRTEPSFQAVEVEAFTSAKEEWQIGDPRKSESGDGGELKYGSDVTIFGNKDSIAGLLETIRDHLILLNAKQLKAEANSRKLLQPPNFKGVGDSFALNTQFSVVPTQNPQSPEVLEGNEEAISKLFGPLLTGYVQASTKNDVFMVQDIATIFESINPVRNQIEAIDLLKLERANRGLYLGGLDYQASEEGFRISRVLDYWNQHFKLWETSVQLFHSLLTQIPEGSDNLKY